MKRLEPRLKLLGPRPCFHSVYRSARLMPSRLRYSVILSTPSMVFPFLTKKNARLCGRAFTYSTSAVIRILHGNNGFIRLKTKPRSMLAYGVGDEVRCQMAVMHFDHPGVAVSEVASDHHQRHAGHDRETGPRVAQTMKADGRANLCPLTRGGH